MRVYAKENACGFRFTREAWGELSNFHPLAAPIAAGPFRFRYERGPVSGGEVRRPPRRPAAHRRGADAEGRGRHRPNVTVSASAPAGTRSAST